MVEQDGGEKNAPWLADLQAKDEALQNLRLHARQQGEIIADLRAGSERKTALSKSLSEQVDRLSERCDELSQLEQQQQQETETQRRLVAELRQQCSSALCEAETSRAAARSAQQHAAELQIQLSESQPEETLRARILELESRLAADVPEGTSGLDTLREQLGRMERRMEVARSVGFVVGSGDDAAEIENHEMQLELEEAQQQQSKLQERLRDALLGGARTQGTDIDGQSSAMNQLQGQLEHERKERAAAEALVAKLQQVDDERIEQVRHTAANANKIAQEAETARDAAIRELMAIQQDSKERDRGQMAEQRRTRRELMQVTQQLEEAKAELVAARSGIIRPAEQDKISPLPLESDGTGAQIGDILQPDDGAGPELMQKVSRRDVRQLRLERDRALRESRRLVEEHELAKAQLATTTAEAIEREQQHAAELETQLADLAEKLAGAEQRAASGVSEREREAELVAENLASEVTRLKDELTRAQERAENADARLATSEEKAREGMERMREGYEDEIGALEAQLTGATASGAVGAASAGAAAGGAGRWRKRAEDAEETMSKWREELTALRTENAKLVGLVRKGADAPEADAMRQPGVASTDAGSLAQGPEEGRGRSGGELGEQASLAVQKELEEIAEDLMKQVESLLAENHQLRDKIEQKRARAKEKKRRAKGSHRAVDDRQEHAASSMDADSGGLEISSSNLGVRLAQSTPQRVQPIETVMGRPGATPAAQPQAGNRLALDQEALSPQRMQSLLYGSNDPGASPNTRAASRAAVKTRRHAAAAMFDPPARTVADPAQVRSLPTGSDSDKIAGLTAEQAAALAAARAAVIAPSPPGTATSTSETSSKQTARERRRLNLLKLAQDIHGGAERASGV